jgi:predicted Zn-dependent protease
MLAGIQHKRGQQAESLETLRTLARKSARADHQMLLAEALIAAERYEEAAEMLERIVEGHQHAPDYIRRRDRPVVARARRLLGDMARASQRG